MKKKNALFIVLLLCMVAGCAVYNSKKALRHIRLGMTRADLVERLDKPNWSGKKADDRYYMKYYLVDDAAVGTAYYFVFDQEMQLVEWYEDKYDDVVDKGDVIGHLLSPY